MKAIIFFLSIWIISNVSNQVFAQQIEGRVIRVEDGNTVEIQGIDNQKQKFILADIDSPELTQDYGEKAKRFLEKMILEKEVIVRIKGKDRKGNYLAEVLIKK